MKGVTGYQLAIIISIIIAIVAIAFVWVFLKMGSESFTKIFDNIVSRFIETVKGLLGPWAGFIMPGL